MDESMVLCSASKYTETFYLNPLYGNLPQKIKDELKIALVLFTEEIGGTITLYYEEDGSLAIATNFEENDFLYDEIGSGLKVNQMRMNKRELFEQLEEYYKLFYGIED